MEAVGVFIAVLVVLELVAPAYFLWMRAAARRARDAERADGGGYAPRVTVIVATYNEESTIRGRLANLAEHDYPRFDVLVMDSGSTDGTRAAVKGFQEERPDFPIQLVEEPERLGKVAALRSAIPHVSGDLVALTDADCLWEPGALRAAAARFADPDVGAVTGLQTLMDGKGAAQEHESGYNKFYNTLRLGETALDSTPIFRGELSVVRADVFAKMSHGSEAPAADDSEIAMTVRKSGRRALVEPRARFREFAPPSLSARRRQKSRRGAGLLQLFVHNAGVAVRPHKWGWFSVICAANLLMLLAAPIATAILAVALPIVLWIAWGPWAVALAAAAVAALWATSVVAPRSPATLPVAYAQSHFALLLAIPLMLKRDARWAPIAEVRDRWREWHGS